MTKFFNAEDGYYSLTQAGTILFIVLIAIIILALAFIRYKATDGEKEAKPSLFSPKQLVFSAVCIALAFVLSYVKLIHMPWGGSVTLCSMLFVVLIGYMYGPKIGLFSALAYGLLQFLQGGGSYILSPLQVAFDYVLAFAVLGVSGFFNKKKHGLIIGYAVAVLLRGIMHSIGGYLYWMDYMPDNFPKSLASVYPILYNFAYILPEAIITIAILCIPPVDKAIKYVKKMAVGETE